MMALQRIFHSRFYIKLTHWEYWPFGVLQAPFFIYWLWLSLRARSFFFFSASNPGIYSGGMMGESKFDVLKLVPSTFKPKAILIRIPSTLDRIESDMKSVGLSFPLIFKPDLGERGWMVRKIHNAQEANQYLTEIKTDFIVQEFLDLAMEFGVFYVRHPKEENGKVISITSKEMLAVEGNGIDTLSKLIADNDRAKLQSERLHGLFKNDWNRVIKAKETVVLNSIGNHCLGTKFLNGNHLITNKLNVSFDTLSKKINGFYFGRYDLRCATLDDLEKGNIMIMELTF